MLPAEERTTEQKLVHILQTIEKLDQRITQLSMHIHPSETTLQRAKRFQIYLGVLGSLVGVLGIIYGGLIAIGVDIPTPMKNRADIRILQKDFVAFTYEIKADRAANARFQNVILAITCTRLTKEQLIFVPECIPYRRTP